MIEKELVTRKTDAPSTPIGSLSKVNTPRTYARAKKTMVNQLVQKASSASPKVTKSGTPQKPKTLQVADSKSVDWHWLLLLFINVELLTVSEA